MAPSEIAAVVSRSGCLQVVLPNFEFRTGTGAHHGALEDAKAALKLAQVSPSP